jgi:paraquat-inducible protein B
VDRGLRAQLQTGSLLTGQLFVELDMHPETPIRLISDEGEGPFPELPTIPASLEQLTTSIKGILAKLEKVETDKIGVELLETLQGANKLAKGASDLINKPELEKAVLDLTEALHSFKSILAKLDRRVEPLAVNLDKAIGAGHQALEKVQVTLDLASDLLKPDSPLQYRFIELAEELSDAARSIRTLVDLLEQDPNSIIFGKEPPGEK